MSRPVRRVFGETDVMKAYCDQLEQWGGAPPLVRREPASCGQVSVHDFMAEYCAIHTDELEALRHEVSGYMQITGDPWADVREHIAEPLVSFSAGVLITLLILYRFIR